MARKRQIEAVVAFADAAFVTRRWPGFAAGFDAARLAERLASLPVAETPPINPLVDWRHLAGALGADGSTPALAVLADYAATGLPAGLSPHPLLRQGVFRRRAPPASGPDWVRAALADPDSGGRAFLPMLDPAFVLGTLGVAVEDLPGYGFASAGRFYLTEGVPRGVPPAAAFDPVFVCAATARPAAAGEGPPSVLARALSAYLDAFEAGRPLSPSPVFDEDFVRAGHPDLAAAHGSAFAGWLAAGRPAIAGTASGLDVFPEAMPQPWWERERRAAAVRGRRRATAGRLVAEAVQRVRTAEPPALAVRVAPRLPEEVWAGETITLAADGFAASPGGEILSITLLLAGVPVATEAFDALPRAEAFARTRDVVEAGRQLFGGFAIAWTGPAPAPGRAAVTLAVAGRSPAGRTVTRTVALGTLSVRRRAPQRRRGTPAPLVAIAMATFEPAEDLFAAQVASIRAQTMGDWRLVVSDETVSEAGRAAVRRIAGGDRRISVLSGVRRGVVGNFERALRAIDAQAPFVALADQDDRWRPDKLERLVGRMTDDVRLVHGAMRLVGADGAPLAGAAPTRRSADPTLLHLLAENEVTGASALLRREVVAAALPMPRLSGLFHDHWLALVARAGGRIVFEPVVVQDYVQHGGNLVGEDPERDRAATARLRRERHGFERLCARLGARDAELRPAELDRALLPALFAVVPAALMRAAAWDALANRAAGTVGFNVAPRPAPDLGLAGLGAVAEALRAAPDAGTPGRIGVADWIAAGLAALRAARARPDLLASAAARHLRRAARS
jgi:hypothetical protein